MYPVSLIVMNNYKRIFSLSNVIKYYTLFRKCLDKIVNQILLLMQINLPRFCRLHCNELFHSNPLNVINHFIQTSRRIFTCFCMVKFFTLGKTLNLLNCYPMLLYTRVLDKGVIVMNFLSVSVIENCSLVMLVAVYD